MLLKQLKREESTLNELLHLFVTELEQVKAEHEMLSAASQNIDNDNQNINNIQTLNNIGTINNDAYYISMTELILINI